MAARPPIVLRRPTPHPASIKCFTDHRTVPDDGRAKHVCQCLESSRRPASTPFHAPDGVWRARPSWQGCNPCQHGSRRPFVLELRGKVRAWAPRERRGQLGLLGLVSAPRPPCSGTPGVALAKAGDHREHRAQRRPDPELLICRHLGAPLRSDPRRKPFKRRAGRRFRSRRPRRRTFAWAATTLVHAALARSSNGADRLRTPAGRGVAHPSSGPVEARTSSRWKLDDSEG
jgi:hypothetical protein